MNHDQTIPASRPSASRPVALALLAGVLIFGGCAERVPSGTVIRQGTAPYALSPLDEINVVRASGEKTSYQVDQTGVADFDGDTIRVQSMEREKVQALLRKRFGPGVSIEIVEFRPNRITVLGEVFHQIHTELTDGPMRVMDAIASANGFTPIANKRRVRLLRQNAGEITVYELDLREMMLGQDLSSNMLLKPGDVITVPRNFL